MPSGPGAEFPESRIAIAMSLRWGLHNEEGLGGRDSKEQSLFGGTATPKPLLGQNLVDGLCHEGVISMVGKGALPWPLGTVGLPLPRHELLQAPPGSLDKASFPDMPRMRGVCKDI